MNDRIVYAGVVILGLMFIGGYLALGTASTSTIETRDEKFCFVDEDCTAAQCCHATDAVNVQNAPSCEYACTLECKAGTLDCNQGEIRCISNRCTALINSVR